MSEGRLIAEPLYILLASLGHPDAHEYVRRKTFKSLEANKSLYEVVREERLNGVLKTIRV